ncbi:hypothetical protein DID80_04755 [Candidatus Marinamargulisbacteria bacterium SCGC AAA071-K20]|nr:hypothetical protein DID80_04755 [Candidatus Marinamargulisbacteria bacterium SCGC AAA071-K20]
MQSHSFHSHLLTHATFSDQIVMSKVSSDADCWTHVLAKGYCSQKALLVLYANYKKQSIHTINSLSIDPDFNKLCVSKLADPESIIGLYQTDSICCIASSDPFLNDIKHIEKIFKRKVEIKLVFPEDLIKFKGYKVENSETLLTKILKMAIQKGASDIHLLNSRDKLTLWIRVDGILLDLLTLNKEDAEHLKKLIKLKANLDISEHSLPQDGGLSVSVNNKEWDIRVSTLPTYFDEDIVLRIFNNNKQLSTLNTLGFEHNITHEIRSICQMKSGLFLVTGPTGSGKTSTLYACLNECVSSTKRVVVSLEDPIERQIPNVRQSQVNSKTNYTFQKGLRAILRQDPDIIMIGEIRDQETAIIALEAAYTGHLVLSSLHTSDVQSTWRRLLHFGCDPFLLSYCVRGILSQSLKPEKCISCRGLGCQKCHFKGLSGRTPQAELLTMKDHNKVYDLSKIDDLISDQQLMTSKDKIWA